MQQKAAKLNAIAAEGSELIFDVLGRLDKGGLLCVVPVVCMRLVFIPFKEQGVGVLSAATAAQFFLAASSELQLK